MDDGMEKGKGSKEVKHINRGMIAKYMDEKKNGISEKDVKMNG